MKKYRKLHESKEVANIHIVKIKANGGEVKQSVQSGKILLEYSFASEDIWYHGAERPLDLTSNTKPIFFTKDKNYAKEYGSKIFTYNVVFNKLFDTSIDESAVKIYNNKFIPYAKGKFKMEIHRFKEIKKGEYVPFITLDWLWLFLRVSKRNGEDFGYDGIVCDEGGFEVSTKSKLSYIPLDVKQVSAVS
jgi:hypothetical protein